MKGFITKKSTLFSMYFRRKVNKSKFMDTRLTQTEDYWNRISKRIVISVGPSTNPGFNFIYHLPTLEKNENFISV